MERFKARARHHSHRQQRPRVPPHALSSHPAAARQVLLGPANLFTRTRWWKRSRLWRLVFLIHPEGFFDPSPGLAHALLAQRIRPRDVAHLLRRKAAAAQSLLAMAATEGELEEAADDVEVAGGKGADPRLLAREAEFCPVTGFDHTAVEWAMPRRLRDLEAEYAKEGLKLPALRFWVRRRPPFCLRRLGDPLREPAQPSLPRLRPLLFPSPTPQTTLLCAVSLRRLDESFLLKTRERDGFEETIVDRCMGFITQMFEEHPRVGAIKGFLLLEAETLLDAWEVRRIASIKATKWALAQAGAGAAVRSLL